jgi:hypothetical protein
MRIAACGGETDRQTDTDRIKTDGRKRQAVQRRTVQRQHTFTWTTDNRRVQKKHKRTQNYMCSLTKQFRADTSGTGYVTHRIEPSQRLCTTTVQHNTASHTDLARQISTSTEHNHSTTSTVQHSNSNSRPVEVLNLTKYRHTILETMEHCSYRAVIVCEQNEQPSQRNGHDRPRQR